MYFAGRSSRVVLVLLVAPWLLPTLGLAADWDSAAKAFADGHFSEAVAAFTAYVEAHPETPQGHYMLGLGLTRLGRATEARGSLARAVELAGDEARYRLALAQAEIKAGNATGAVEALAPLDPAALGRETENYANLLVLAADHAADLARVRDVLQRATGQLAGERSLWLALAETEQKLGDEEASFAALNEAYGLDPANVDLAGRAVRAAFMAADGSADDAKQAWYNRAFAVASRLVEAKPSALAWRWGGKALMGRQEYEKAETWFARSAELEPSASVSYHQGRCLLAGEAAAENAITALVRLDAALAQEPDAALRSQIHSARGVAFHYLEDFMSAAAAYRLAGNGDKAAEMGTLAEIKKGNDEWESFRSECDRKHRVAEKFRAENADLRGTDGWQLIEDEIALQLSGCEEILADLNG